MGAQEHLTLFEMIKEKNFEYRTGGNKYVLNKLLLTELAAM